MGYSRQTSATYGGLTSQLIGLKASVVNFLMPIAYHSLPSEILCLNEPALFWLFWEHILYKSGYFSVMACLLIFHNDVVIGIL